MLSDQVLSRPRAVPQQVFALQEFLAAQPRGLLDMLREGVAWQRLEDLIAVRSGTRNDRSNSA